MTVRATPGRLVAAVLGAVALAFAALPTPSVADEPTGTDADGPRLAANAENLEAAADELDDPAGGTFETVADVDDPLRALQWNLDRIEAPRAWSITRGDPQVTIAVVDTGVDHHHRDLSGAFWEHPETGAYGFNHVDGSFETFVNRDQDWHGTAVAGVAAARADDDYGMAGVAPNVRIMVQRIYASTSYGTVPTDVSYKQAVQAIEAAADGGADVILLTWNGRTSNGGLLTAIEEAGVPVVVAAGNDGMDLSDAPTLERYPAMYRTPNMVTVAASDREDRILSNARVQSNYGVRDVDLAAPGEEIIGVGASAGHDLFEGTSFAAPQVAGALALGRSLSPDASAGELVATVVRTARQTPDLIDKVTSGGVLDIAAFLRGLDRPACGDGIEPADFADVSAGGTHAEGIDCTVWYGVAQGIDADRFAPRRTMTRGEMATFLARTLEAAGDELPKDPPTVYTDVEDTTHEQAIATVTAAGIARGIGDEQFGPTLPVTRAQMATMVVAVVERLVDADLTTERDWFDDIDGNTHERSILIARDLEITRGTSDPRIFEPARWMTREQMASFIAKTLDELGRRSITATPLP